ncbi:sulfatase [Zavarzinia compransoris]|uniref:Sulfatase n=2 Tax=Zavarzinia compransoris TaxID=1264899 RepID=A0A317DYM6_9PROT|nr:sulfatase [Zavarzinia compransoris]
MKRLLIALFVLAAVLAGAFFAIGGREGVILLAVRFMSPAVAANREVAWDEGPATPEGRGDRPNVIVILADDLGFNDVGFYGGGRVPTPNIDRLAREGVNFPAGYAGNATCAPSRAALMTGRYPTRFGFEFTPAPIGLARVIGHFDSTAPVKPVYHEEREAETPPFETMGLPVTEITIARLLRDAGYHTLHLGKWHLGETREFQPNAHGFDESLGFYSGASLFMDPKDPEAVNAYQDFDPIDRFLWAALPYGVRWNGGDMFRPKGHMTDYLTDEAVTAIGRNRNRPFFMYLAYNAPHTPLQATKADYDAVAGIADHTERTYAAMLLSLDRNVGRVLAALKQAGIDDRTLVVFTSDNGGAHYVGIDGLNKPYRGWKASFFEGGIRVPFFMRWPGHLPAGSTYGAPISHFDIFATAAGAAGVPVPADRPIDGVDLLPFLTGARGGRPHERLFWRSGPYEVVQAGDWKLQLTNLPPRDWLFDLKADPAERHDVAAANPEKVAELKAMLAAFRQEQVKPLWPALIEAPVPLDHPLNRPWAPDDAHIYWSN